MIEWRRRCFLMSFLGEVLFTFQIVLIRPAAGDCKPASKWYGHFSQSGPLTLYHKARSFALNANSKSL
jgi:hypothetical protein